MTRLSSLAETGALIGEPARAAMLVALMDGRSLTAGELAKVAGVSPPTASGHLARLVEAGMLAASSQGRHRYFRLGSPAIATMIEGMMGVAGLVEATRGGKPIITGPKRGALRHARICYDHLAGEIAVGIADSLVASGSINLTHEGAAMTMDGIAFLNGLGLYLHGGCAERPGQQHRHLFGRPCMDWSERRPHIAGQIGRALLQLLLDRHWLRRVEGSREVDVTPAGARALEQHFGIRQAPR
ncbi:MAG TPA: winged helix-turn-helix domain-containing protein [Sphingomonas sp.]|nr:winged helix-turn-helix domain-containing protein [Sphingomonas sp.]